ncbi:ATP-dependent translocase ABCB1-like [Watersipora subatra]|uniref:ATP-dependent translocase ABCB1-like n=1 Tax=Watersipora subatra TaxID=2589382 RepID=UPI00355C44E5
MGDEKAGQANGHNNGGEIKNGAKANGFSEKSSSTSSISSGQTDDLQSAKRRGILCCKPGADNIKEQPERVSFFRLFRFSDKLDVLLMVTGTLVMVLLGLLVPGNLFYFGNLMTNFVLFETSESANSTNLTGCAAENAAQKLQEPSGGLMPEENLRGVLDSYIKILVGFGVFAFLAAYTGITFWTWTGERQIRRIRNAYFQAIMQQSIAWFDVHNAGELNTRMVEDMQRLSEGFGDKMATSVQWISTFIGGYALAFIVGWKLTLVLLTACPLIVIVFAAASRFMMRMVRQELTAYAKAGSVAEETFSSIRTVAAFGGEKKAEDLYNGHLKNALVKGVRKGTIGGLISGLIMLIVFCSCALTLWYGAKLSREECFETGGILQVFFGVIVGSMSLGFALPVLENINSARAAAAALFKTIDAYVEIDSSSEIGLRPDHLEGDVEFEDVGFTYPSRQEIKVLDGLSFTVKKGQTVALVGESGCGKSTTIQLVQRFYEANEGKILIDGKDLKDYNLTWLRNYMGIVSQEPVLFATTIGENIRLGAKWGDEVTQEQIEMAAKQANCYDFISKLPKGFDTLVGEQGVQLSGGQKQRVAIARALIRNPAILLLDEATSALDTQSEAIVQDALDKASKGRTTIVIAHRLSTVRGADKIFAFRNGRVHEQGTHAELMSMEGIYYSLVMRQVEREKEEEKENRANVEKMERQRSLSGDSTQEKLTTKDTRIERAGSFRRSKRLGSLRSLKHNILDGNFAGLNQPGEDDDLEEIALEDGVVVARQLNSVKSRDKKADISMFELLRMNSPEWYLIVIGTIAALITGVVHLAFALLLSEVVGLLSEPDPEVQRTKIGQVAGWFVLSGITCAIVITTQNACFALSGERLTMRLRKKSFAAIVKQDIGFFDEEDNSVGFLASRLASDASLVKGATGQRVGVLLQNTATVIGALVIAFTFVWELTLVVIVFLPLMTAAGMIQHRLFRGFSAMEKAGIEEGGKMAQEAITAMRTVTSLNRQRYFTDKLYQHFKNLYKADLKKSFVYGIAFAASQSLVFFMYAICFGFGGYLIVCDCLPWRSEAIKFFHLMRIFAAVTFGTQSVGKNFSSLPDLERAKLAALKIIKLLNKEPSIDSTSSAGARPDKSEGEISFTDVEFSYPTRKAVQVLQGVSFTVKKGETVALVGSSGCGKSTSVSLLERFYDGISGTVAIDDKDVKILNIQWLRQQLGLVSQEPTLFNASIAENIAYGDNSREVTMPEIIEAATKANAHNFITSLPQGYETNVGSKGTQLSGGQKQRIAIARALVRNPSILLLDEATSALDTESEKVVQEALDEAMQGRTAIVIAHRLSTIRNADKIGVIDNGKVVEFDTHEQLLEKRGFYFNLINAQL